MKFNEGMDMFYLAGARAKVMRLMFKKGFAATGRQVATLCGISHTMAIRVLKDLEGVRRQAGKARGGGKGCNRRAEIVPDRQEGIGVKLRLKTTVKNTDTKWEKRFSGICGI
ncbi:MAG: hypothetical protein LLG37_04875 [Spirochaetia bacterium]|nr:hypothetical protein [Spirochaetia bacterium]